MGRTLLAAVLLAAAFTLVGPPRLRFVQQYAAASEVLSMRPGVAEPGAPAWTSGVVEAGDFATIGLRVDDEPAAPVSVRWRTAGVWSPWHGLEFEAAVGPDAATAEAGRVRRSHGDAVTSEPVWIGHADAYELGGGPDLATRSPEAIVVRPHGVDTVAETVTPRAGAVTFGRPDIHPRSDWGARGAAGSISTASELKLAVVHHADTANTYNAGDVPGILRSIQAFHVEGRGWSDIGYNFAVDKFGGMWEGREGSLDRLSVGAHAEGFNTGTVGVVALGNYTVAAPSSPLIASIGEIIAWRLANAFIDPTSTVAFTSGGSPSIPAGVTVNLPRVVGHRDVGSTDCPGQYLYAQLSQVRLVVNGRTADKASPFGVLEVAAPGPTSMVVQGWAIDPSTTGAVEVHAYVDGVGTNLGPADDSRIDLTGPFPYFGPGHGFRHVFSGVSPGAHEVCVFAINLGLGSNTLVACRTVTVVTGAPIGGVDRIFPSPDGALFVTGWAYDPDTTDPVHVRVSIDGRDVDTGAASANHSNAAVSPLYGTARGFDHTATGLAAGTHTVCFTLVNLGPGSNTALGCNTFSTPAGSPFGRIDVAAGGPDGSVLVTGWAIDPDVSAPIAVHVYVDSVGFNLGPTTGSRPDLAAAFPGYGASHGFVLATTGTIGPGLHKVCAYGINVGVGSNTAVACRDIIVPGGSPIGVVERAEGGSDGTIGVSGWTLDPNTAGSIAVHAYVDGVGTNLGLTNRARTDIAAAFPGWGPPHGFAWLATGLAPGRHSVCLFAIDANGDPNTLLRCSSTTVPGGSPVGSIDVARASGSSLTVSGWAVDPDSSLSIPIHVYVDGVGVDTGPTPLNRGDLAASFPTYGTRHGYSYTATAAPGTHSVCVFAINRGVGSNTLLGCRNVTTA